MVEDPEYLLDTGLIIGFILVLLGVDHKTELIDSQILKNGLEVGVEEVKAVLTKEEKKEIRKRKRLQRRLEAGILEDIDIESMSPTKKNQNNQNKNKNRRLNKGKSTMMR